jgi:hypothetical protein
MSSVETQPSNAQELVSRKLLAAFLIFGTLGAIVMSWISYAAMIR